MTFPGSAKTLCHALAESVERGADRVFIHHLGVDWTYGEIWRQAAALANWLRSHGLETGDRVALLAPNSWKYVAGYFGAQMAGGIAVGLNPETSPRELHHTLAHCQPAAIIADPACYDDVVAVRSRLATVRMVIPLDGQDHEIRSLGRDSIDWNEVAAGPPIRRIVCRDQSDLAQIIYTSGTTGHPKGVTLTHGNLLANCRSIIEYLRLTADDRVFVVLPFYYSYGNSLLFTHAAAGGGLILASDFVYWNRALELMHQQQATGLAGVPTTFAMLLHRSRFASMEFPDLRYMTCAGGALAPATLRRLRESFPRVAFFPMYGQTEATARLSTLLPDELDQRPGSIGRGIPGVTLTVRDEGGAPVAPGEVGEITAAGANLMAGYWNDPEATQAVLSAHGLKTGDLARADDDGYLYIVGRRSDMIKHGAHRISPQEIEEVLLELPGVAEAAVAGQPDEILGEAIVAFVVPSPANSAITPEAILDHCRQTLPRHKQPRQVILVDSLPKTSSGKIKRNELRVPGS